MPRELETPEGPEGQGRRLPPESLEESSLPNPMMLSFKPPEAGWESSLLFQATQLLIAVTTPLGSKHRALSATHRIHQMLFGIVLTALLKSICKCDFW